MPAFLFRLHKQKAEFVSALGQLPNTTLLSLCKRCMAFAVQEKNTLFVRKRCTRCIFAVYCSYEACVRLAICNSKPPQKEKANERRRLPYAKTKTKI